MVRGVKVFVEIFSRMASNLRKSQKFRPAKYKRYTVVFREPPSSIVLKLAENHSFQWEIQCTCIRVCTCVYMYVFMCVCVCVHVRMHAHTQQTQHCTHIHLYIHHHTHVHIHIIIISYTYMYNHIYTTCTCTCTLQQFSWIRFTANMMIKCRNIGNIHVLVSCLL